MNKFGTGLDNLEAKFIHKFKIFDDEDHSALEIGKTIELERITFMKESYQNRLDLLSLFMALLKMQKKIFENMKI